MNEIAELILVTLLPFLELRASIPYGIFKTNLNLLTIFSICIITNIILGVLIYLLIDYIIKNITKIKPIKKIWEKYIKRTQKRIHSYVNKYGEFALAFFIGIPLPGSGVYSGAIAAYLLGLNYKKFVIANIIGVLIAGTIVTIISFTGFQALRIFVKVI